MDMTVVYSVWRYYNCITSDRAYIYTPICNLAIGIVYITFHSHSRLARNLLEIEYTLLYWEITGVLLFSTQFARCLLLGLPVTFNQVRDLIIMA